MIIRADAAVKFFIDLSNKNAIKSISEVETKSEAVAKKFNNAGKALTVGLTTPLIAFGTYAVKTSADFDKASNQMKASLGATSSELKNYEQIMRNIYNANFGESYEDVANAIATVSKNLIGLNDASLQNVTESAITLRDTFGIDVNESVRSVNALMTNFGITAEESMNLLAQGLNSNLNYSDEFIDNINEYSVQFGKLGLSAEDMFNIFQSGADAGAWNLDKIGDAVKEFSIRAIDGSQTTADGFKALGMDADVMAKKFAKGGETARTSFYEVIKALGEMDDPVAQSIAGVNLFGTMWEDLGPEVVTQLGSIKGMYDQTVDSMENMKNVKYDDLGSMLESLKRQLGDVALEAGNELMPAIQGIIGGIQNLVTWFKNLDPETKTMIGNIAQVATVVGPALILFSKLVGAIKNVAGIFKTVGSGILKAKNKMVDFSGAIKGGLGTLGSFAKSLGTTTLTFAKLAIQTGISTAKLIAQKTAMLASTVATKAMTLAQKALNLAMNMNPIGLIIMAIMALIAIIVTLWTKCEWFRNGVMTAINAIWSVIKSVVQFIMNAFTTLFNVASSIFNAIWNVIKSVFGFIWNLIQSYVTFWITVWNTIFNVVSTVLTTIWNTIKSVFSFIWGIISGVINNIVSAFNKVATVVKSVFSKVKTAISSMFRGIVNIIKAPINGVIGLINGAIKGLNRIKLPDWVPGIGGKGINIPLIPKLAAGTNYVESEGLAYLHEGEAVVPKKYNPVIGGYENYNQPVYVSVIADMDVNKFGKAFVREIKTFSGGAKNSYNYGGAK